MILCYGTDCNTAGIATVFSISKDGSELYAECPICDKIMKEALKQEYYDCYDYITEEEYCERLLLREL